MDHREAAARLYRDYGPAVYRRCLRLLRNREAAQDATQEVFVRLVRNMERLEDRGGALPWIYRVTTNHCLNVLRNAGRRGEGALLVDLEADDRQATEALPDRLLAQEILQRFDACLAAAISVGACFNAAWLWVLTRRSGARKPTPEWGAFLLKVVVALYMMGGVIWFGMGSESSWFAIPAGTRALKLAAVVTGAMAAYFATLWLLGFRLRQFARHA